jgi:hypothetical protein
LHCDTIYVEVTNFVGGLEWKKGMIKNFIFTKRLEKISPKYKSHLKVLDITIVITNQFRTNGTNMH